MIQGTFEWYYARFGCITMSDRIDTIISGSPLALNNLLKTIRWERSIKEDTEHVKREWEREMAAGRNVESLRWGREHEHEAIAQFELIDNVECVRPPFRFHPLWPDLVGDSTDFILMDGDRAVLTGEVKCYFTPENHVMALRYGMDPKHYNQVQGHMECWDAPLGMFISYDPRMKIVDRQLYRQRVERDPAWGQIFRTRMEEFVKNYRAGTKFEFAMKGGKDGIPSLF